MTDYEALAETIGNSGKSPTEAAHLLDELPASEHEAAVTALYWLAWRWRASEQPLRAQYVSKVIIEIGRLYRHKPHEALGFMLIGDYLNAVELNYEGANRALEQAGELFLEAGDNFGWARTRIGKLACTRELGKSERLQAIEDARKAEEVFLQSSHETALLKRLSLYQNWAIFYRRLGQYNEAITYHGLIIQAAAGLAETEQLELVAHALYNMGVIYGEQGNIYQATQQLEHCYDLYQQIEDIMGQLMTLHSLAGCEMMQGRYQQALTRLNHIQKLIESYGENTANEYFFWHIYAAIGKAECFQRTNYYERMQAELSPFLKTGIQGREQAVILFLYGVAMGENGHLKQAEEAFRQALNLPYTRDSVDIGLVRLHRGRVYLRRGDLDKALEDGTDALERFANAGLQLEEAHARLLVGETLYSKHQSLEDVKNIVQKALRISIARGANMLISQAHTLLGHVEQVDGNRVGAIRHYLKAATVVDDLQRDLTITLRPGFLGDKGEALQSLMSLYLKSTNQSQANRRKAFAVLERFKAQVFSAYLATGSTTLLDNQKANSATQDQFLRLRGEVQALDTLIDTSPLYTPRTGSNDHIRKQIREEQRKRQEKVTLAKNKRRDLRMLAKALQTKDQANPTHNKHLLRRLHEHLALQPQTVLVEYYSDGSFVHAFVVNGQRLKHYQLGDVKTVESCITSLKRTIKSALGTLQFYNNPHSQMTDLEILSDELFCDAGAVRAFNHVTYQLYELLLKPMLQDLPSNGCLLIVPYGMLHQIPFHLLTIHPDKVDIAQSRYLIDEYQVSILPTATHLLAFRSTRPSTSGALIIYDDKVGEFPKAHIDARMVYNITGGVIHQARQDVDLLLRQPPHQLLHLIAHGAFDDRHPEESFVELDGRQLMYGDLMQCDLSYPLITLTSCDSGQLKMYASRVAMGDDQIGIGRAFLHRGAGAVLVSRWMIGDGLTHTFIEHFYKGIWQEGHSKAYAMQQAQIAVRQAIPRLHPVYWGPFQLIGNPDAL